jgi:hypothetical protein
MSEKLGKDEQYSPGLKVQSSLTKKDFRRSPVADQIKDILEAN